MKDFDNYFEKNPVVAAGIVLMLWAAAEFIVGFVA